MSNEAIKAQEIQASFNVVSIQLNPSCLEKDRQEVLDVFKRNTGSWSRLTNAPTRLKIEFFSISSNGAAETLKIALERRETAPSPTDSIS